MRNIDFSSWQSVLATLFGFHARGPTRPSGPAGRDKGGRAKADASVSGRGSGGMGGGGAMGLGVGGSVPAEDAAAPSHPSN